MVANPKKTLMMFCQRTKGSEYVFPLLEAPLLFFSAVTIVKMHKELPCLEHCHSITQFSDFFLNPEIFAFLCKERASVKKVCASSV